MLEASGGAPIFCCCAAAPPHNTRDERETRIADLTRPPMFPPGLANLRWLVRQSIIAEHAGFALSFPKTKSRVWGKMISMHHVRASRRRFLQFVAASPLFARSALAEGA